MSQEIAHTRPTPLWAVNALTFFASIGTGVVWSGIAFIAKHEYGYTKTQTLSLYLVLGAMYAGGALCAGRLVRNLRRRIDPRSILAFLMLIGAMVCLGPLADRSARMLWMVAVAMTVQQSWLWPIIESYLSAGRHGREMRRAIGWWNLIWTSAVAAGLLLMAPLIEHQARMSLVMVGGVYAASIIFLRWFHPHPAVHDEAQQQASIQPEYPSLLAAARLLLPLSYVLNSAMSPLLPYLFGRLEVTAFWETPAAATWTMARIVAVTVMWRLGFWHGRWGTLLLGGVTMTIGFAMIVTAFSLSLVLSGLALLGVGMGIVYYAALYYAMAVGRAAVEAGGRHEALIGTGYAIGPVAGFVGLSVAEMAQQIGRPLWDGLGVVAVVWLLTAFVAILTLRPYLTARRARIGARSSPL